jgi:hypothetical protein
MVSIESTSISYPFRVQSDSGYLHLRLRSQIELSKAFSLFDYLNNADKKGYTNTIQGNSHQNDLKGQHISSQMFNFGDYLKQGNNATVWQLTSTYRQRLGIEDCKENSALKGRVISTQRRSLGLAVTVIKHRPERAA